MLFRIGDNVAVTSKKPKRNTVVYKQSTNSLVILDRYRDMSKGKENNC